MLVELNEPSEEKMPIGMHVIPTTGRQFYWTGKIAIGIRHDAPKPVTTQGEELIQKLWMSNR